MTVTFESLLAEALRLPVEERSRMASRLIESVDEAEDVDLSPAWQAEIRRRMDSVRQGSATLIPHTEVMSGAQHMLSQLRNSTAL